MLLILLLKSPRAALRVVRTAWRLSQAYGTVQLLVLVPLVAVLLLLPLAFPPASALAPVEAGGAAPQEPTLARRQDGAVAPGLLSTSQSLEWGAQR